MFGFFLIAFVILSAALFGAAYYVWVVPQQAQNDVLASRLRQLRAQSMTGARLRGGSSLIKSESRGNLAALGDFFNWIRPLKRLQAYIHQADRKWRAADVFSLCVLIAAGMFAVLGMMGVTAIVLRTLIALGLASLPIVYIMWIRGRRLHKFETALPDAIDLFNRSMKAGHNIHSGLDTMASEALDPVRGEFKKVTEELALGSPIEAALHNLGERVPLIDLRFFVTGLILQRQTGANMVVVLENLALLLRERLNLAEKLKASTSQQRLSAMILCSLPVVMVIGFWFLKPQYIRWFMEDEFGQTVGTGALIWEFLGILVIRKMSNPKF